MADGAKQSGMPAELREVVWALRRARVAPGRLASALLLAMRLGIGEHFVELCDAATHAVGPSTLEDALDEAWRTARTLNLPLNAGMNSRVVSTLVLLRYDLSREDPTSDVPQAADTQVRWRELWGRVDLLLEYSRRLEVELERLQSDRAPGSADHSVTLARLCALALHGVKAAFAATYKDVPWEEMEYLLVMFIEAHTEYTTVAHAVASTPSIRAHLRCFKELVQKYVLVHRAEPDPEVAMRRLKKGPRKERAAFLGEVVDKPLTDLRRDFARLRDRHTLKEINKTLGVSSDVLLSLDDDVWAAWGWLSLRWGLFVVGERVKYSWLSPNLSPRWAVLVEAMAPGGFLAVMSTIRDDQEHGEDQSNAKTLALSKMKKPERKNMAQELQKLQNATRAAFVAAESEVEWTDDIDWEGKDRVLAAKKRDNEDSRDFIGEEVLKILEPAKHNAEVDFEQIRTVVHSEADQYLRKFLLIQSAFQFAREHIPEAVPRVSLLLYIKSTEHTESFQAELCGVTPSVSTPLENLRRALTATAAAPEGQLYDFAVHGALRELASRWHEDDKVVPTAVPFSPALFGRQLRNYLNHLDEVFWSPLEVVALHKLLRDERIPLEHDGARPRLLDPRWYRAENERLLRLVELKRDMFRWAREGRLGELQRLVEGGADVSARDCQNQTLLHAAAQGGEAHVVEWLLGLGAEAVDPLAEDWFGRTALHMARTAAVAEALLTAYPAYSECQRGWSTHLHCAAAYGREQVVAMLLRDPRDLDAEHNGTTPLYLASRQGHDQVVRLLLEAGARSQADADGDTPLLAAARSGSAPTVRLLLGAAPPPADEDCWRAAREAAQLVREEACSALLDELVVRGLLQWSPDTDWVLYNASHGGSSAVAVMLLDPSPDAAHEGQTAIVRTLLGRGAGPLGEDEEGASALEYAVLWDSLDIITALVERIPGGALQAALGRALSMATVHGQLRAMQRLVHHGADVNAVGMEGRTPLGWACMTGHTEVLQWLLQRGADPHLDPCLDHYLHWAALCGRLGVAKLLVPPLHGRDQGQDDPGGEEPSALSVAVQAGSRDDLQRILGRFVKHLRPLSSRYTREDKLRDKAEATAALRRKEKEEDGRLCLLQQVDKAGFTALQRAVGASALPVVKYLLEREGELLQRIYSKHKNTGVPRLDGLSVYARDARGITALQWGGSQGCAPSVAEALLERMAADVWLALGHKDLQEVRGMAVEALGLVTPYRDSERLVRALCEWLSRSWRDVQAGKQGLEDIRRSAVATLCSGQDAEWRAAVDLVRWHLEEETVHLQDLRQCAVLAMRRCVQLGSHGKQALQLLCQWVCDLSDETVDGVDGERDGEHRGVLSAIACEALEISRKRGDQDSSDAIIRRLLGRDEEAVGWRGISYTSVIRGIFKFFLISFVLRLIIYLLFFEKPSVDEGRTRFEALSKFHLPSLLKAVEQDIKKKLLLKKN